MNSPGLALGAAGFLKGPWQLGGTARLGWAWALLNAPPGGLLPARPPPPRATYCPGALALSLAPAPGQLPGCLTSARGLFSTQRAVCGPVAVAPPGASEKGPTLAVLDRKLSFSQTPPALDVQKGGRGAGPAARAGDLSWLWPKGQEGSACLFSFSGVALDPGAGCSLLHCCPAH